MSLYVMAKKAKMRDQARIYNRNGFSLFTKAGSTVSCGSQDSTAVVTSLGYGLRHKRLTTTKCGCNVFNVMPNTSTSEHMYRIKADHIYTDVSNATVKVMSNTTCSSSSGESVGTASNGKSKDATLNRLKKCQISKDPPVARTAGQQIEKVRAAVNTCAAANLKPLANTICRTSG